MPNEQVGKADKPVPSDATSPERVLVNTTLHQGDVLYIPRGFVHEARTSNDAPSFHLTVALATHDWSWGALARRVLDAQKDPKAESKARALMQVKSDNQIEWPWRRSIPPAFLKNQKADHAETLANQVEDQTKLPKGSLVSCLKQLAAVHNQRQDEAMVASAARAVEELYSPRHSALETNAWVRRKREGEAPKRREGYEAAQGLIAREEIADTLLAALGKITVEPFCVSSIGNCPLLCAFGKACFAQVCIDMALLVECSDSDESKLVRKNGKSLASASGDDDDDDEE